MTDIKLQDLPTIVDVGLCAGSDVELTIHTVDKLESLVSTRVPTKQVDDLVKLFRGYEASPDSVTLVWPRVSKFLAAKELADCCPKWAGVLPTAVDEFESLIKSGQMVSAIGLVLGERGLQNALDRYNVTILDVETMGWDRAEPALRITFSGKPRVKRIVTAVWRPEGIVLVCNGAFGWNAIVAKIARTNPSQ